MLSPRGQEAVGIFFWGRIDSLEATLCTSMVWSNYGSCWVRDMKNWSPERESSQRPEELSHALDWRSWNNPHPFGHLEVPQVASGSKYQLWLAWVEPRNEVQVKMVWGCSFQTRLTWHVHSKEWGRVLDGKVHMYFFWPDLGTSRLVVWWCSWPFWPLVSFQ